MSDGDDSVACVFQPVDVGEGPFTVVAWKAKARHHIEKGKPVITYKGGDGVVRKYPSCAMGTVTNVATMPPGHIVNMGDHLISVAPCQHAVVMKDMCAHCGANLRAEMGRPGERTVSTSANVAMVANIPELHVSHDVAILQSETDEAHLLNDRKLVLLVDLDQTLIHSTDHPSNIDGVEDAIRYKMQSTSAEYFTKVRPHAYALLHRLKDKFEYHICTYGNRLYAHRIAELLDKEGALFAPSRILSRNECFDPHRKSANLRALFPRGDHMVIIIDDRADVWQNAPNLIQVPPYRYFRNTGDINDPDGPGNKPSTEAEGEKEAKAGPVPDFDDYLLHLETMLERLHTLFYDMYDKYEVDMEAGETGEKPETRYLLPYARRKVLAGCHIVFSGCFPSSYKSIDCPLGRMAIEFGAKVTDQLHIRQKRHDDGTISPMTTHLLLSRVGTAKMHTAGNYNKRHRHHHIHIVTPKWLHDSCERWARVGEEEYSAIPVVGNDEDGASTSSCDEGEVEKEEHFLNADIVHSMDDEVDAGMADSSSSSSSSDSSNNEEEGNESGSREGANGSADTLEMAPSSEEGERDATVEEGEEERDAMAEELERQLMPDDNVNE